MKQIIIDERILNMEDNSQTNQETKGMTKQVENAATKVQNAVTQKNLKSRLFTKLAPMLGPIIFWAMVIVIAIVIVVGIATFLMTSPGLIMGKLKEIAKQVGNGFWHIFLGESTANQIEEQAVYDVLDYLEQSNYDLKGYGFLSSYTYEDMDTDVTGEDKYDFKEDKGIKTAIPKKVIIDKDSDGVIRYDEDTEEHAKNRIKEADSSYVFMYLVSDNYVYTVANNNWAFDGNDGNGFWNKVVDFFKGVGINAAHVATNIWDLFTGSHTSGALGSNFGQGLLTFYYEKDQFGVKGDFFDNSISNKIDIDTDSKKLSITHASGFAWLNKNTMEYEVDGWTGRYGMPLEFLLSVHIATMMPDLAYDMVQAFPTEVEIYLHYISELEVEDEKGKTETVKTYVPYIAHVANHWYRDVYFVEPSDKDTQIVQVDKDYETLVKERWTLYETYTSEESEKYFGNTDMAGEYKLYAISETGEYAKSKDEVKNKDKFENRLEEVDGKVLFKGTIEEANPTISIMKGTDSEEPISDQIESVEDNKISVSKKALTVSFSSTTGKDDDLDTEEIVEQPIDDPIQNLEFILKNKFPSKSDRPLMSPIDTEWSYITGLISDTDEAHKEINAFVSNHASLYEDPIGELKRDLDTWGHTQIEGQSDWEYISENRTEFEGRNTGAFPHYTTIINAWGSIVSNNSLIGLVQEIINNKGEKSDDIALNINNYANSMRENYPGLYDELIVYNEDDINEYDWYKTNGVWTAYKLNDDGTFSQKGEGLRSETNPIIKRFFLNNTYFRFDGTSDTADAIMQLREAYGIKEGSLDYYVANKNATEETNIKLEDVLKYQTQLLDSDGNPKGKAISIDDVSGQVALNQDSLNAFSMLENTHTLDADYIYRDFKELVVELGYFTKEELTESIPRILAWLVPETGSATYPYRSIDKKENEFGTMIHSRGDIDAQKSIKLKEAEKNQTVLTTNNAYESGSSLLEEMEEDTSSTDSETNTLKKSDNSGVNKGDLDPGKFSGDTLIDTAKNCWQYIVNDGGYTYAGASIPVNNGKTVDCSSYASWVLYEYGYKDFAGAQHVTQQFLQTNWNDIYGWEEISVGASEDATPKLQAGDFLVRDHGNNDGHITFVYSTEDGLKLFDCGRASFWANKDYLDGIPVSATGNFINGQKDYGDGKIIRIEDAVNKKKKPYTGYDGNEAVVSPVTGVLLEYGTYANEKESEKDERKNVDFEDCIDKVGYAKILTLDVENYAKLEAYTENYWQSNSLILKDEIDRGDRRNLFKEDEELDKDPIEDIKDKNKWTSLNKTVYGYKEFVEKYERLGIAGNIIYIDGFKCEDVDDSKSSDENKAETLPAGTPISINNFKTLPDQLDNSDAMRPSLYVKEEKYKAIDEKHTNKVNTENKIKSEAASSIYVSNEKDDLIFIKEGTVLGRTITDKELLESPSYRNGKYGTYEQVKKEKDKNGKKIDRVIGNYIRIIMRSKVEDTVIENVEDYMKLDEETEPDINWELFYWLPFESGGTDNEDEGPECVGAILYNNEYAAGISQWTVLDDMNNITDILIPKCLEKNPGLCAPLEKYASWSGGDFLADITGAKEFNQTMKDICKVDREEFLKIQMEIEKEGDLDPILEENPWLEDRAPCVQGEIMHLKCWGARTSWISAFKDKSDKEIMEEVRHVIETTTTDAEGLEDAIARRAFNEPEIGFGILDGRLSGSDIEEWVRTADESIITNAGIEQR